MKTRGDLERAFRKDFFRAADQEDLVWIIQMTLVLPFDWWKLESRNRWKAFVRCFSSFVLYHPKIRWYKSWKLFSVNWFTLWKTEPCLFGGRIKVKLWVLLCEPKYLFLNGKSFWQRDWGLNPGAWWNAFDV